MIVACIPDKPEFKMLQEANRANCAIYKGIILQWKRSFFCIDRCKKYGTTPSFSSKEGKIMDGTVVSHMNKYVQSP